jgi:signal transduction histidine kinase
MRTRLVGTYLFLLILVLLALELPLAANVAARHTEQVVIDRDADASRFASLADPALRSGELMTLSSELQRYYELYGIVAAVADRDGTVVAGTGDRATFDPPQIRDWLARALAGERVGGDHTVWPWQPAPLAVAVPVTSNGEVVGAVLTLSPTGKLRDEVRGVWGELAAGGLATGVVFVVVAVLLTRWILRPVTHLDAAAHRISGGVLDARAQDELGPPELRRVARSFNSMADAVSDVLDRQRAFVAQASHQMRNPLAALRLRVEELAGFIAEPAGRDEHRLALEETDRLRHILDGLLTLARAERGQQRCEQLDAAATADGRVAGWQPLAAREGITLRRTGAASAPVTAVPTAVGQALDALIDNALKFAGQGATVVVDVAVVGDVVDVHVVDDGPGVAEADRPRAGQRFWRAPHAQNIEGSGLGLPIATALVEASGGRLDLFPARPSGLDVRLRFPSPAAGRRLVDGRPAPALSSAG